MTQRTRVAVIGAGWWGAQHARVFSARSDTELCAIVGRNEARTRTRADEYGASAFTDIDVMLEQTRPDLVSLSLPNTEHFEPTRQVIRAGVPLLVEKPLVFDVAEADLLLAEAAERDLFFAINFNHRYARPARLARRAIAENRIGDLVFTNWRFGGEGTSEHHPHANLIETQCHAFDLLEHLCGPIASVAAEMTDRTRPGQWTTMVIALRFASGAAGSIVGSYDSSYAYRHVHTLELNGTLGRISIDDTVASYRYQAAGSETVETWRAGYFNDRDRSFEQTFDRHMDRMIPALVSGDDPPVHARAGRRALMLAYATIEAFESGRRVVV